MEGRGSCKAPPRRVTVTICVWAVIAAGCVAPSVGSSRTSAPLIPDVLAKPALLLEKARPAIESLWPGWWSDRRGYVLFERGRVALLMSRSGGPGFVPAGRPPGWERFALRPFLRGTPLGHPRADAGLALDYVLGGDTVVVVAADSNHFRTIEVLLHESFHAFQHRRFRAVAEGGSLVADADGVDIDSLAVAVERERALLRVALRECGASRVRRVLAFMDARTRRLDALPAHLRAAEDWVERTEGSAHLIGYGAALNAVGRPRTELRDTLVTQLGVPLPSYPRRFGRIADLFRWRLYASGAAQLLLSEEFGSDWRQAVERGAAPVTVLGESVLRRGPDAPGCP